MVNYMPNGTNNDMRLAVRCFSSVESEDSWFMKHEHARMSK